MKLAMKSVTGSLKSRLTIFIISLVIVCIWSLYYYASTILREDLKKVLGEQIFSTATIVAAQINHELEFRLQGLESTAAVLSAPFDNTSQLQSLLELSRFLPALFNGGYFVTNRDGIAIASAPVSLGRVGLDYMDRDHVTAALKEGKTTVGKPVIGKVLNKPVFSMGTPIRDKKGVIIGALVGVVDLSKPNFLDGITNIGYGKTGGYVLMMPQHNLNVTATDKSRILQPMPAAGVNPLMDQYVRGFEGYGTVVDSRGMEVLSASRQIPAAKWVLVARIPIREAFAPLEAMQQRILYAALLISVIAGGLCWLIVRRQLAPLLTAAETVANNSDSNEPIPPLPVITNDEVGQLVNALNNLLKSVATREDHLNQSRKLLQLVIDTVPSHIFWKDSGLNYLGCNTAFARAAGFSEPAEVIGRNDYQMVWKEYADRYRADDLQVIATGIPRLSIEEPITLQDSTTRWILTSKAPLLNSDQQTIGVLGVYSDITDRKHAEELLIRNGERLKEAQRIACIGNWELDLVSNTLVWSDEIFRIFEIDQEQFGATYEAFLDAIHPDDRESVKQAYAASLNNRLPYEITHRLLMADGRIKYVVEKCETIYDADGMPLRSVGTVQDITREKAAEAERSNLHHQLQQAQKLESIGRLAGGVAHDFNNMLSVILGHAELALMHADESNPIHRDLLEIRNAAERSANLTRQLLAFARKQTIMPQVMNLNEALSGMLTMLQRLIGENISLTWRPAPDLWNVSADPSQIDQIIANLCVNARDAIKNTGRIMIETKNYSIDSSYCEEHPDALAGDYVQISISDDGSGMDRETLAHIFEPFYTTKELGKGTGLGLATVFGIVRQNNGFINVSSEPCEGTTFTINLPRFTADSAADRSVAATPPPIQKGTETILLVEDEPAILNMTAMMLDKQGYTVLKASSAVDAIRLAKEHEEAIHLLMTDVIMPEMNGRDLARLLMSNQPGMKRLFMSGYTSDIIASHGVLESGVHFIQKPFSLPRMAAKVREALDA